MVELLARESAHRDAGGASIWMRLFCVATTAMLLAPQLGAQLPEATVALDNDSYLPISVEALEHLRDGDAECLQALRGGAGQELAWTRCFEAWHAALNESRPGDNAPVGLSLREPDLVIDGNRELIDQRWPDRDRSFARRTESIENAILRRLCGLDSEVVARWSSRFEALGGAVLQALRTADLSRDRWVSSLADLERRFPATPSGMLAALQLAELELEAGRWHATRAWLERAEMHRVLSGMEKTQPGMERTQPGMESTPSASPGNAIEIRVQRLRELSRAPLAKDEVWAGARRFEVGEFHPLVLPGFRKRRISARYEGQPGLAFFDDDERVAVQTPGTLWILSESDEDRIFEPWRLGLELEQPIPSRVERPGKDWPMFPIADGEVLYLVSGRASAPDSNLLQKIQAPRELVPPIALWSLGGDGLHHSNGEHLELDEVLENGMWEFQPGPLLVDDLLLVQARQWIEILPDVQENGEADSNPMLASPGEANTWLLALDAESGRPRWKRFLGRGTDAVRDLRASFGRSSLIRTPGAALQATDRSVFVVTNLGAAFLLDVADGRLRWSFRNRRRRSEEPGWAGGSRPRRLDHEGDCQQNEFPVLLMASADSDELYALSSALDFAPRGASAPNMVAFAPLQIGEGESLLGGRPDQVLILGRAGARRTLSAHDLENGARFDSIYFGREERYMRGALLNSSHVLLAAEGGFYLFDRNRELYLESFQPLAMESDFVAGGLWARGKTLYLLAQGALYRFEME